MAIRTPLEASIEPTPSTVTVTAGMGSAGQALSAVACSSVQLTNTDPGRNPLEYKVGADAWKVLEASDGVPLAVNLATTTVMVRKGNTTAGGVRLGVVVQAMQSTQPVGGAPSAVDGAGNMVGGPISTACRAFLPLNQPASTGYPRDLSGNAITAYPMGTYTDAAWAANAGYLTVGAGANLGLVIPSTELDLSAADGRNLLFAIGVKKATPAGEEPLLGWSSGAGTGAGINLAVTSAGKLRVYGTTTQLSTANVAASTLTVADGTDHTIALFIRNDINQLEVYVDGWLSNAVSYRNAAGHRDFGQSAFLALGGAGGSEQTTYAAQFRGLHAYTVPDRFTAIQLLVQKLRANILQPLSAGDL